MYVLSFKLLYVKVILIFRSYWLKSLEKGKFVGMFMLSLISHVEVMYS